VNAEKAIKIFGITDTGKLIKTTKKFATAPGIIKSDYRNNG
jgi:hypothetical protein